MTETSAQSAAAGSSMEQEAQEKLFHSLGGGPWTILKDSEFRDDINFGIYCALGDPASRSKFLADPGWDLTPTAGAPGFSQGGGETTYHRNWSEDGVEPFVLEREFYGAREDYVEIQQEFRLFHNLALDKQTGNLIKPHDDGSEEVAVKFNGNQVLVRTRLIKQYMAARQMDLHIYIDSLVYGSSDETIPEEWVIETDSTRLELHVQKKGFPFKKPSTRLLGKKILPAGPIETCGVWPFESAQEYPEFIIGEDEHGRPVRYTCDPDQLANYFGKNDHAPHYLTPVHFRKDVLQKYYDRPELYSVSDGGVRCAALWSCRIDNDHADRVIVFLGDLGRDLPASERNYWRGFMITPDTKISETNFRRSFLGQFTDPKSVDLIFKRRYDELNEAWSDLHGWPLFRSPEGPDKHLISRLRLPLNDSQAEFESSIRLLTQLLVDALNEKQIESQLSTKQPNEKGISKLERLFAEEERLQGNDVKVLRSLQEVRSRVTAHRKGSDYEKVLDKNFGNRRGREAVEFLMRDLLDWLSKVLDSLQDSPGSA
ncbi:hypothetical protein ACFVTE_16995 [Arthrobacter sp. NPDC058097]|uniref:hypothetical protein n=1 Tax=Arthrobacter sp. NPDC058097 TaxID=3346340 RepID=UPI0036DF599C